MPWLNISRCFMLMYFYMAQPGTGQHEGRVSVREGSHHAGSAADAHARLHIFRAPPPNDLIFVSHSADEALS